MTDSERVWAKENKLRKTNLITATSYPCGRIVYKAKDGRLLYLDAGVWHGTYLEYCMEVVAKK